MIEESCMMEEIILTPFGRMDLRLSYSSLIMKGKLRVCFQKKNKSGVVTMKILGFGQKIFEPAALQGKRYEKLLLIVAVVRIWFPKRW